MRYFETLHKNNMLYIERGGRPLFLKGKKEVMKMNVKNCLKKIQKIVSTAFFKFCELVEIDYTNRLTLIIVLNICILVVIVGMLVVKGV